VVFIHNNDISFYAKQLDLVTKYSALDLDIKDDIIVLQKKPTLEKVSFVCKQLFTLLIYNLFGSRFARNPRINNSQQIESITNVVKQCISNINHELINKTDTFDKAPFRYNWQHLNSNLTSDNKSQYLHLLRSIDNYRDWISDFNLELRSYPRGYPVFVTSHRSRLDRVLQKLSLDIHQTLKQKTNLKEKTSLNKNSEWEFNGMIANLALRLRVNYGLPEAVEHAFNLPNYVDLEEKLPLLNDAMTDQNPRTIIKYLLSEYPNSMAPEYKDKVYSAAQRQLERHAALKNDPEIKIAVSKVEQLRNKN